MMRAVIFALILCFSASAQSDQQFATLSDLRLESGETIASCRIGYRTFGSLNAARTNAILFPTWFSGKSSDLASFMGPGRLVDSSRFFVVAVDALANGVSCSPSNSSGTFPHVTIRDMVNSQYRLLREHLKIDRLHAVIGISMGGMQSFEWMVAYPEFASRVIPIIGSPKLETPDLLLWNAELSAIEAVEKSGGDLREAMRAVGAMHQFALYSPDWYTAQKPASEFAAIKSQIDSSALTGMDPRDWAAQLRAMLSHDISRHFGGAMDKAAAAVSARVLVVVASQDHMVNPQPALRLASLAGFDTLILSSNCGHMATSCESARLTAAVSAFL